MEVPAAFKANLGDDECATVEVRLPSYLMCQMPDYRLNKLHRVSKASSRILANLLRTEVPIKQRPHRRVMASQGARTVEQLPSAQMVAQLEQRPQRKMLSLSKMHLRKLLRLLPRVLLPKLRQPSLTSPLQPITAKYESKGVHESRKKDTKTSLRLILESRVLGTPNHQRPRRRTLLLLLRLLGMRMPARYKVLLIRSLRQLQVSPMVQLRDLCKLEEPALE